MLPEDLLEECRKHGVTFRVTADKKLKPVPGFPKDFPPELKDQCLQKRDLLVVVLSTRAFLEGVWHNASQEEERGDLVAALKRISSEIVLTQMARYQQACLGRMPADKDPVPNIDQLLEGVS